MKNSMPGIKTRFLVISDTHGIDLSPELIQPAEVVIHCDDLTLQSKLDEFRTAIQLVEEFDAPLKLVIFGYHQVTMDIPVFQKKRIAEAPSSLDPTLVQKVYGDSGDARSLFHDTSISLLDEETHHFTQQNGASLTVFASPVCPSCHSHPFFVRVFLESPDYSEVHISQVPFREDTIPPYIH